MASGLGIGEKVASGTVTVKITDASGNEISDVDLLAQFAGTYTIKVSAGGKAKLSLTTTAAGDLGEDENENKQYDAGEEADGVLGVALSQSVNVMQIVISNTGSITVKTDATAETPFSGEGATKSASEMHTGVQSATFYYGLEVTNITAEDTVTSAGTLIPVVYDHQANNGAGAEISGS